MGIVESLPVQRVRPVLALPLYLGTMRDHSGYGNHAVPAGGQWGTSGNSDGFMVPAHAQRATIPDSPELQTNGHVSIFAWGYNRTHPLATVVAKSDGGGTDYEFYLDTAAGGSICIWDGVGVSSLAHNVVGSRSLAVAMSNGEVPSFSVDGAFVGNGGAAAVVTANDAPLDIGSMYVGNPWLNPLFGVIIYTDILTQAEILSLHEWSQSRFTPRKQWPDAGLRYPDRETNLLIDGDMEAAGVAAYAFAPADTVLTKVPGSPSGGSQVLNVAYGGTANPQAYQNILTVGENYTVTGLARGDGVAVPIVRDAAAGMAWTGTNSPLWQPVTVVGTAGNTALTLRSQVAGVGSCEFDNIKVWDNPPGYTPETGDPMFIDNIQSARVTLADETSGKLSNTDFLINSGTWALAEDATGKYLSCVGNGQLEYGLIGANGFTTDMFVATGATLAKNATNFQINAVAGDIVRAVRFTA